MEHMRHDNGIERTQLVYYNYVIHQSTNEASYLEGRCRHRDDVKAPVCGHSCPEP